MEAPCVYWPDDGIVPSSNNNNNNTAKNIKIQEEEEEITIEQPIVQHIGDTERKLHEAA